MGKTIDTDILNDLDDIDIDIISKNINLDMMLQPIKKNNKYYSKYIKRLGRMDRKSMLVQKNMPEIALKLYYKRDQNFTKLFQLSAMSFKKDFKQIIEETFGGETNLEDLKDYSAEEYIALLSKITDVLGSKINLELFIVQAKLNGIVIDQCIQDELFGLWEHSLEVKDIRDEYQREKEYIIKKQEDITNKKMKSQKQHYESILLEDEEGKKELTKNIEGKLKLINKLEEEIVNKEERINNICLENSKMDKKIKDSYEKCDRMQNNIEELENKINKKKEEYKEQFKKEWENKNVELMKVNKELEELISNRNREVEELTRKKNELELSLDSVQNLTDLYMASREESIANKFAAATIEESVTTKVERQPNKFKYEYSDITDLYTIEGNQKEDRLVLKTLDDFEDILEDNLINIGCKMKVNELEGTFNASINVGLLPLLCGFGARKVAFALIAARYSEKPTVISIPNGFSCIQQLEDLIKSAPTASVVIEDLFGKMTENVILPIIRNNSEKKLIFCCEDIENLRYLESYYYNYFEIISLKGLNNKNTWELTYGNANDLLPCIEYDNKSLGYKLIKYLLNEVDAEGITDTYIITRANVITYMINKMYYDMREALKIWSMQELSFILSKEQYDGIIEIIDNNELMLEGI